ncbi:flagellar motor protein MotB [Salinisphaera sp.]|uniref:flagellar motor protein MotB n=1 Tax=Salinisphaera sp. TaxID=1914330 RepID=UPI002D78F05D|nr:flagellar motor protein MotB [Salinisphaera sp.]HET7313518.1 flagellar motor protein MotB [Salinisphaera sp.]
MSDDNARRPIVIRRKRHQRHASHGTWKIAYADFMTALMAFFLVMWLLSGLSESELKNVSEYFRTPLKVALVGGDRPSASNSAIPGGGDDRVHSEGEVALTTPRATNYHDNRRLERLRARLQAQIEQDPKLNRMSSQIKIQMVPDGLRIQIFDSKRRPMFKIGSARLEPDIEQLIERIAPILSTVDNKITLTGHTDDLPYASGPDAYGNWELSADRANAARRALVAGGMAPDKLLRVIGAADTQHIQGDRPGSPLNRRISILVLNDRAQRRIETSGRSIETRTVTIGSRPLSASAYVPEDMNLGAMLGWVPKVPRVPNDISG